MIRSPERKAFVAEHRGISPAEIVKLGRKRGFQMNERYVYQTRAALNKAEKTGGSRQGDNGHHGHAEEVSKKEFVERLADLPVTDVIERARDEHGWKLAPNYVYGVRSRAKRAHDEPEPEMVVKQHEEVAIESPAPEPQPIPARASDGGHGDAYKLIKGLIISYGLNVVETEFQAIKQNVLAM